MKSYEEHTAAIWEKAEAIESGRVQAVPEITEDPASRRRARWITGIATVAVLAVVTAVGFALFAPGRQKPPAASDVSGVVSVSPSGTDPSRPESDPSSVPSEEESASGRPEESGQPEESSQPTTSRPSAVISTPSPSEAEPSDSRPSASAAPSDSRPAGSDASFPALTPAPDGEIPFTELAHEVYMTTGGEATRAAWVLAAEDLQPVVQELLCRGLPSGEWREHIVRNVEIPPLVKCAPQEADWYRTHALLVVAVDYPKAHNDRIDRLEKQGNTLTVSYTAGQIASAGEQAYRTCHMLAVERRAAEGITSVRLAGTEVPLLIRDPSLPEQAGAHPLRYADGYRRPSGTFSDVIPFFAVYQTTPPLGDPVNVFRELPSLEEMVGWLCSQRPEIDNDGILSTTAAYFRWRGALPVPVPGGNDWDLTGVELGKSCSLRYVWRRGESDRLTFTCATLGYETAGRSADEIAASYAAQGQTTVQHLEKPTMTLYTDFQVGCEIVDQYRGSSSGLMRLPTADGDVVVSCSVQMTRDKGMTPDKTYTSLVFSWEMDGCRMSSGFSARGEDVLPKLETRMREMLRTFSLQYVIVE